MSENGEGILRLIRNVQQLNKEISELLKTFEQTVGKKGFNSIGGKSVIKELSTSIDYPNIWSPTYMYRHYENKNNILEKLYVNIVLDNVDEPGLVEEPLILLLKIKYKETPDYSIWDPWNIWFSMNSRKTRKEFNLEEINIDKDKFIDNAERDLDIDADTVSEFLFYAIELDQITCASDIEEIIDKLE